MLCISWSTLISVSGVCWPFTDRLKPPLSPAVQTVSRWLSDWTWLKAEQIHRSAYCSAWNRRLKSGYYSPYMNPFLHVEKSPKVWLHPHPLIGHESVDQIQASMLPIFQPILDRKPCLLALTEPAASLEHEGKGRCLSEVARGWAKQSSSVWMIARSQAVVMFADPGLAPSANNLQADS